MFPLGDDNSQRRSVPVVTFALIALNVLVFFVELNGGQTFIQQWAFVPRRFAADPVGQAHTIFTAMFMHGGWLHLFGNMLYLWIFGDNVEDEFGPFKFLAFYLFCGIAATLAQYYVSMRSSVPNVGASGAIAGVLAAYLLMFPSARVNVLVYNQVVAMPAMIVLGFWIVLQLFSGFGSIAATSQTADQGGVAYMAHVGGFVAGLVLTFLFRGRRDSSRAGWLVARQRTALAYRHRTDRARNHRPTARAARLPSPKIRDAHRIEFAMLNRPKSVRSTARELRHKPALRRRERDVSRSQTHRRSSARAIES